MSILDIIPNTPEWYTIRKKTVGSSEVAALFDKSPHTTKFELYHRKIGSIADAIEDNERMFWGRKLEHQIAMGAAELKGWHLLPPQGYYMHPNFPGMGATPDMLATVPGREGIGILEIKNVDGLIFRKEWINEEPPMYYLLQLQHQLACSSFKWGAVVALVGGNDLKISFYDRHAGSIASIESAVVKFWADVRERNEPKVSGDDLDALKKVYPIHGIEIDLSGDNELPGLCSHWGQLREARLAIEKQEATAKAEILQKVGNANIAYCSGFRIERKEVVMNMKAKEAHTQIQNRFNVKETI